MSADVAHRRVTVEGTRLHLACTGRGAPLVLLHGWPEFWLSWEPVMRRLAGRFTLIAPDLRGFGASDKLPPGRHGETTAERHAADLLGILDALGLDRVGLIGHDVGAYVAQSFARSHPGRLRGLFFFDCPYPGLGSRPAQPRHQRETWYQNFNQLPWAAELVGGSREACRLYIGHFLRHWAGGRPDAFDDVLDAFVDNFMQPGNLQGGFNWYIAAAPGRLAVQEERAPPSPRITVPTRVMWGDHDPLFPYAWTDRLGETFERLELSPFEGAGHFPHKEEPDRAAEAIAAFFGSLP